MSMTGPSINDLGRAVGEHPTRIAGLLYGSSLGSVGLCIALWIRAKIVGEDERGNAERRALFVGLWPPMLWLIGDTFSLQAQRTSRSGPRAARAWSRWRRR
jgi:hypothetical protein